MLRVLMKKQLAEVFKGYFFDAKKNRMRSKGAIAAYFLLFIVVMVGMLGGMFTSLALSLCGVLTDVGLGWLYFALMGGIAVALGAFGSVFNSYAALYLAKDNDLLLSLPIPVRTIITARLVNVYLMGAMYAATAVVPAVVVYWIVAGTTAARVIGGVLLLLIVTVIVMLLILGKKQKKLLIIMCAVLILCWVLINPVLDALGVSGTNMVEAFAVPMQQIARVVTQERPLTGEETELLSEIFWLDKIPQLYDPQTVDPIKFETFRYNRTGYILDNLGQYLKLYLSLGAKYPGDYLKAWIEETKGYWNGGYEFWIYTLNMGGAGYGIARSGGDNIIASLFASAFRLMNEPEAMKIFSSVGLYVWGLIGCCVINVLKKREEFLLTIAPLVLVVGLWLGTPVFCEFRYAYPVVLTMPLILGVTLFRRKE